METMGNARPTGLARRVMLETREGAKPSEVISKPREFGKVLGLK